MYCIDMFNTYLLYVYIYIYICFIPVYFLLISFLFNVEVQFRIMFKTLQFNVEVQFRVEVQIQS